MPSGARLAIVLLLATAALTAAAFAVVRPPVPPRMTSYRGPIHWLGRWAYWVTQPLLRAIAALGLTANGVSAIGAGVSVLAGVAAGLGEWGWAGFLLVMGSWCDLIDGEVARTTGTQSTAGAFLDSNLDRLSEMALLGGLAASLPDRSGVLWAVAALSTSLWVSYARARGEGLGVACPTFGLERPHRAVLLMFALLVAAFLPENAAAALLEAVCAAIAVGAGLTALGRLLVIHRMLREAPATVARAPRAPPTGTA